MHGITDYRLNLAFVHRHRFLDDGAFGTNLLRRHLDIKKLESSRQPIDKNKFSLLIGSFLHFLAQPVVRVTFSINREAVVSIAGHNDNVTVGIFDAADDPFPVNRVPCRSVVFLARWSAFQETPKGLSPNKFIFRRSMSK